MCLRFAVSLAIIFLGFTPKSVNSLHLIATTTCLVVFVLIIDLIGSSCTHEGFWWTERTRHITYAAKTRLLKKDLAATLKKGDTVNLEDVARRGGGEKGYYETN